MIKLHSNSINNSLLTNKVLEAYITNFWNEIFSPVVKASLAPKHLMLMCQIEFTDSTLGYRTLGHLRKVNFEDKELFIEYLSKSLGSLSEAYTTNPISKITFTYIIKDGLATDSRRLLQDHTIKTINTHRFNNMNLPISMNPLDFGELRNKSIFDGFTRYTMLLNNRIFEIDVTSDEMVNKVTILGNIYLSWIDTKIVVGGAEYFKREIKKSTIYFLDGEIVLRKQLLTAKPIKKDTMDSVLLIYLSLQLQPPIY
jgi:hypothetical protein